MISNIFFLIKRTERQIYVEQCSTDINELCLFDDIGQFGAWQKICPSYELKIFKKDYKNLGKYWLVSISSFVST